MEEWIPLQDYPGYSVSSAGRVRNDQRDRVLAIVRVESGHTFVGIMKGGVQVKRSVAKLVASTFLTRPKQTYFNTPIHLDGNLANCHAENLAWRPRWFAMEYTQQFRKEQPKHPPIRNKATGETFLDCWPLVIRDGLLYRDIVMATHNFSYVVPTMETFEWVE